QASLTMFRDRDEKIPVITCSDQAWSDDPSWVGIGGDPSFVSIHADISKAYPRDNWPSRLKGSAGEFLDLEYAAEPDWYNHDWHWEGYGPSLTIDPSIPSQATSWYTEMTAPFPLTPSYGFFSVDKDHQDLCTTTFNKIDSLVKEITKCDLFPVGSPQPSPFDISILSNRFESQSALQDAGAESRRAVLSRLGFLSWWILSIPKWRTSLPAEAVSELEHLGLRNTPKRGFLIDFEECWQEINVPHLVKCGVPFYYRWTQALRLQHRFTKLDPRLILSLGEEERETFTIEDVGEYDVEATLALAERFDDYFQPLD
ncbi:hypothetical protein GALMADRAFT_51104, partial [Galerina marginata CBS 339.88]